MFILQSIFKMNLVFFFLQFLLNLLSSLVYMGGDLQNLIYFCYALLMIIGCKCLQSQTSWNFFFLKKGCRTIYIFAPWFLRIIWCYIFFNICLDRLYNVYPWGVMNQSISLKPFKYLKWHNYIPEGQYK